MKQVLMIVTLADVKYKVGINEHYHANIHSQDKYAFELPNGEVFTHPTANGCMTMIQKFHDNYLMSGKWEI